MKILINDHSGHPFQIQLSRELARRQYIITHTYSANFQTPKGNFELTEINDNLKIIPIYYDSTFNKYSILKRKKQEEEFAEKLIVIIEKFKPQVLINSNTPLFAQKIIQNHCLEHNIKFIYWCQDIYSIAMEKILIKKVGYIGKLIGSYFKNLEKKQLQKSDYIINITEDFNIIFKKWKIQNNHFSVITNWAPIVEIPLTKKENEWSLNKLYHDTVNIIYSGTLGLKHNPELLLNLALELKNNKKIKVIVISEGLGADFLKEKKIAYNLDNLELLPFQNFKDMPKILGSADILLGILEPEAGIFSVPSKVLTYLCAGRPVVLSVPLENLSSKIITESGSGISVIPNDQNQFNQAISKILKNQDLKKEMGLNARKFAELNFDIRLITDKFEKIILNV
jgi:colanic acid biosynthesis glycosyl transferase WcaI